MLNIYYVIFIDISFAYNLDVVTNRQLLVTTTDESSYGITVRRVLNPVYNDVAVTSGPETTASASLIYGTQTSRRTGDSALDPRITVSHISLSPVETSVSQVPSPLFQPSSGTKINMQHLSSIEELYPVTTSDVNQYRSEHKRDIPTDPVTGYSVLLRPNKIKPRGQISAYESVTVQDVCLQLEPDGNQAITQMNNQLQLPLRIISPREALRSSSQSKIVPTDPETGYSTMLRPGKVVPPPGPVPVYDVINVKNTHPPVRTATTNQ